MGVDSDTRGWILTALSAVACCFGTTLICVDVIVRRFPGMKDFKIAESDAFLSASLSLSAGVILFSALYSMLPSAKDYLKNGDLSPKAASFLLIGLFLTGVFGIRVISQIMHKFIPSHIVDCDHTHDEEEADKSRHDEMTETRPDESDENGHICSKTPGPQGTHATETSPLLSQTPCLHLERTNTEPVGSIGRKSLSNNYVTAPNSRRPSSTFTRVLSRTLSKYVSSNKEECDEDGPCMGFSDPCGQYCFKIAQKRSSMMPSHTHSHYKTPTWRRHSEAFRPRPPVPEDEIAAPESDALFSQPYENGRLGNESKTTRRTTVRRSRSSTHHYHHPEHEHDSHQHHTNHSHNHTGAAEHHHHVPTNAFMSIGVQTSIAIALHKTPEGFITFATNHASRSLGFSVFIALFIHNIADGFVLSLPLYLALNSRLRAVVYSSLLGGLSQPLGAGLAVLWFKLSSSHGQAVTNDLAYGCVFSVTAGVLASVALSLLAESLQLTHNKNTCVAFAFVGMAILGVSQALTAT